MAQMATKVLTAHVPRPLAEEVDQMPARLDRSRGRITKQAYRSGSARKKRVKP